MSTLAERRGLRLFTLCALYVGQGIPWGFTATTIPAYLAGRGVETADVGASLALTTLPYSLKWAFGPLVDSISFGRFGHRRPWIIFAQLLMALTILAMLALPDLAEQLHVLAWMILIHTAFNALQDVAVDALAVDVLDDAERGAANGLMYACKYLGGFAGGFGLATVIEQVDLRVALLAQGGLLLAIMLVPLLVRERPRAASDATDVDFGPVLVGLANAMSVRSALVCALLMAVVNLAGGMLYANAFALFTKTLGVDPAAYTRLIGGWALLFGAGGAALGGVLASLLGARGVAAGASIAMALGWLGFGALDAYWTWTPLAYIALVWEGTMQGAMNASLFAVCMDQTWPRVGASQYAAYMALSNVGTTVGYAAAGPTSEMFTDSGRYFVGAGVQLALTAMLLAITPGETRRALASPDRKPDLRGVILLVAVVVVLVFFTIRQVVKLLAS